MNPNPISLKNRFPFRLGTTSYIVPADILPNVEFLAPLVDDVELILFETDQGGNWPDAGTVARLCELAAEHDLTYSVHFPLGLRLGSAEEVQRMSAVDTCRRLVERMLPLDPFSWVLHFEGDRRGPTPVDDVTSWIARLGGSLSDVLARGLDPRRVCIETLDYPFDIVAPVVEANDVSVCLDIGHLNLCDYDVSAALRRWRGRARVVHLHGIRDGKDHQAVDAFDPEELRGLLECFSVTGKDERVVTIEVFGEEPFVKSMKTLEGYL